MKHLAGSWMGTVELALALAPALAPLCPARAFALAVAEPTVRIEPAIRAVQVGDA